MHFYINVKSRQLLQAHYTSSRFSFSTTMIAAKTKVITDIKSALSFTQQV